MSSSRIKDILMKEQMNYTLMPSLERVAVIKLAITLWNQDDIMDLIAKAEIIRTICTERQKEWLVVEEKVEKNLQQLPLPESLKQKVSDFFQPIGFEILKWSKYHESFLPEGIYTRFVKENSNKLCWTPRGTVDRKETALALIKDENLDINERYTLACIYCFQNDILTLWSKMTENCQRSFYFNVETRVTNQEKLVLFWTSDICRDSHRVKELRGAKWNACANYQDAFEYAVAHGNKVATEYFLQKLTSEEREESLIESAERIIYDISSYTTCLEDTDILFFLLSQMTEEEHVKVLKKYSYRVLRSFLIWPRQGSFLEMAKLLLPFLHQSIFYFLVVDIITKITDGVKDFNYKKLFREFWQQSPIIYRKRVICVCAEDSPFLNLLERSDKEILKLILDDA